MDPVTLAVAAAVAGGLTREAVGSAYKALVGAISRRFGADSRVADAVRQVESSPESEGRRQVLHEEVVRSGADEDAEILEAAKNLADTVDATPEGHSVIVTITGDHNAVAGGDHSTASVTVTGRPERPRP